MKPKQYRVWAAGEMHYPSIITFDASGASFASNNGGGGAFRVPLADVMESLGRKDRKGNDLFEDDIIECEYYAGLPTTEGIALVWRGVVVYSLDASFYVKRIDDGCPYSVGFSGSAVKRWEVIGNTRQHPHLLERP